jgi:hypothetical protein
MELHMPAKSITAFVPGLVLLWMALLPEPAHAYVGPGPGLEFIPYFFSLLTWAGVAAGAVLFWPVAALVRRLRGTPSGPATHAPATADATGHAASHPAAEVR